MSSSGFPNIVHKKALFFLATVANIGSMKLHAWLNLERGRLTALAQHLQLTQGAVSQMRGPGGVPAKHINKVRRWTKNQVTVEDMLPNDEWAGQRGSLDPEFTAASLK